MPKAVREHQRVIELDPKLAEGHLNLAYDYQRVGKNSQARAEYAIACKLEAKFCGATSR
jgi:Tfp pilus assembly protein PilF